MAGRVALSFTLACTLLPATAVAKRPPTAPTTVEQEAPAPAHEWYYAANGRTEGPFDDAAFVSAYLAGRVGDTTMVWWEGAASWTPLAQASWFTELDRWYVRHGTKGFGPLTGSALRAKLAKGRAQGHAVDKLEVRMELSGWVPVASAAPLADAPVAAPLPWEPGQADRPEPVPTSTSPAAATASTSAPTTHVPAPVPIASATHHDDTAALDESARANKLRKGGIIVLGVGAGLIVIGGGIAGGYSTGAVGAKALWAGVAMAGVGVVPVIIGAALLGAGNSKLRKLAQRGATAGVRLDALASRGHGGLALSGRF